MSLAACENCWDDPCTCAHANKLGDEHKARHALLHHALDELVADWLTHTEKRLSSATVLELMQWAHNQTLKPTEHVTARAPERMSMDVEKIDTFNFALVGTDATRLVIGLAAVAMTHEQALVLAA